MEQCICPYEEGMILQSGVGRVELAPSKTWSRGPSERERHNAAEY
jgi:hypothetical protein